MRVRCIRRSRIHRRHNRSGGAFSTRPAGRVVRDSKIHNQKGFLPYPPLFAGLGGREAKSRRADMLRFVVYMLVLTCTHMLHNMHRRTTPQNGMRGNNWQDRPFSGCESDASVGRGSIADTAGAGAHSAPARRAHPPNSEGDVEQLSRRRCSRVLRRAAGLVEDVEDFLLPCVHSSPSSPFGFRLVATRQCVGDVVGRRHPLEVWCPSMGCGQAPYCGHHAVDGTVVAVALGKGALAGYVVDVCRPLKAGVSQRRWL